MVKWAKKKIGENFPLFNLSFQNRYCDKLYVILNNNYIEA